MGWTFKTIDHEPLILTPDKEEHNPETKTFYDKHVECIDIGERWKHPETGQIVIRITVPEYNKLSGIRMPETHLKGNGWPSKKFEMEGKQKKALEKNPMHSTMSDYKMSNPDSIPAKSKKRNLKRMKKRNVKVKKNETKGI